MKTIDKTYVTTETIKNSKFITILLPANSKEQVKQYLETIKIQYPKATHYCYAYILQNDKGMSDDGEPSKTAGAPILNILEKEHLINILAIVVRYFGGIKLGPGGLIRAYSHGLQNLIKTANIFEIIPGKQLNISFPFSKEKEILYLLHPTQIKKKTYDTLCHYIIEIPEEKIASIEHLATIESCISILTKKTD